MRTKMDGKEISSEDLKNLKDEMNESGIIDKKESFVNVPTMQKGHNDDGTIKEERIKPHIYEIDD